MNKKKFRGIFMRFVDRTSSVVSEKKDGRDVYPKITLRVRVSNDIPFSHRMCR